MTETRWGLLIDRRAAMTFNAFPPEDQARIRSSLGHLLGPNAEERLGGRVHRLPGDEPLYSMRVPPDLRIIFARQCDSISVVDILRRGTLETFASGSVSSNSVGELDAEPEPSKSRPPQPELVPAAQAKLKRRTRRGAC
jgi:hypothetical protein